MPRSAGALQITVAVPNPRVGQRIASLLLERRLAACVQLVGPITSRYRWRGKIDRSREYLLVVKTRPALFAAVEAAVRERHPYEVPEIAAHRLAPVHVPYLVWLHAETRARSLPARTPRSPSPARKKRPVSSRRPRPGSAPGARSRASR